MGNVDCVKLESIFTSNDEKVKCGDIFISTSGFSLACGFCEEHEFYTFNAYSDHFRCHLQKETIIKLETKVSQASSFENHLNAEAATALEDPLHSELQPETIKHEYVHAISDSELGNSLRIDRTAPNVRIEPFQRECRNSEPEQQESNKSGPEQPFSSCDPEEPNKSGIKTRHKKFICDQCNEVLTTKRTFAAHKWRVHLIGVACRLCEKQFATETSRKNHEKIHTGEPRKKEKYKRECYCTDPDCPKHKYRRPAPKKPLSNCGHCDAVFVFKHDLRQHWWTVHNVGHKCQFCEKQFYQYAHRGKHERTHTGQRPFTCTYCPLTFSTQTYWKTHIRLHENDLPFLCTTCGDRFVTKTILKYHTRDKHPSDSDTQEGYACSLCGMRFAKSYSLRSHKDIHHNKNGPLTCEICQRVFNRRVCLAQHMKIHYGVKYKCRFCDASFSQAASKKGHERNKHNVL